MQNIFIPTIKFGAIAVLAFSVFVSEALAAPMLAPSSATGISDTSAVLVNKVVNSSSSNVTVWFEWGDTPNPTTVIGMRDIYGEGFFQGYLSGLRTGTTYYFRAAAMGDGATIYSPVTAFTTSGGTASVSIANSVQTNTISTGVSAQNGGTTKVSNAGAASASAPVQKTSNTKNISATAAVGNTAEGVLPGTLIGWVALLIGLLIVFLIVAMILDSVEERRKAREVARKKKLERDTETE